MALVAQPGGGRPPYYCSCCNASAVSSARTAFLFQRCRTSLDLIRYLLHDLGIFPAPDPPSMHQQLNDALVDVAQAGKQLVFVIDKAQNLSESMLQTVRLLSDFEIVQDKLCKSSLRGSRN